MQVWIVLFYQKCPRLIHVVSKMTCISRGINFFYLKEVCIVRFFSLYIESVFYRN
ncbi:hypothetical protein CLOBOL_07252 [Enterocloster bolteae ATCC BAA-613]|uniref:Uncharacterized protein n=1 Tax=Enterocloster bolteae (strain ATCC BAA-613 / DSM 15670 / CCUG 46953 / JCM 12243 / WAL 16351) TaxID=411902 RepID=A8S5M3_ENTBW|nr:hypothetical protein CLOBOL_07252 [Enterocloster bolteae ATCC BAA-613]